MLLYSSLLPTHLTFGLMTKPCHFFIPSAKKCTGACWLVRALDSGPSDEAWGVMILPISGNDKKLQQWSGPLSSLPILSLSPNQNVSPKWPSAAGLLLRRRSPVSPTPTRPPSTSGPPPQVQLPNSREPLSPTPPTHPQPICFLFPSISSVPVLPPQPRRPSLPPESFLPSTGPYTPLRTLLPSTGHSSPPLRRRHQWVWPLRLSCVLPMHHQHHRESVHPRHVRTAALGLASATILVFISIVCLLVVFMCWYSGRKRVGCATDATTSLLLQHSWTDRCGEKCTCRSSFARMYG
jgi:hypothetical protein